MIYKSIRTCVVSLLILAFLSMGGVKAHAAPVDQLRQAYAALEVADHDYQGHRAKAMGAIEAAGKELGVKIRGEGKGHEKQGVSDEQLRTAKGLLEQASGGLSGKPLRHVERAIREISVALDIK